MADSSQFIDKKTRERWLKNFGQCRSLDEVVKRSVHAKVGNGRATYPPNGVTYRGLMKTKQELDAVVAAQSAEIERLRGILKDSGVKHG